MPEIGADTQVSLLQSDFSPTVDDVPFSPYPDGVTAGGRGT